MVHPFIRRTVSRFLENPILMGLNENMAQNLRHGTVHVHGSKKARHLGFMVNDQTRLFSMNESELNQMFDQVIDLGFEPISIEVVQPNGNVEWHEYKLA